MGVLNGLADSFKEVAVSAINREVESRISPLTGSTAPTGLPNAINSGPKQAIRTGDPSGPANAPKTGGFNKSMLFVGLAVVIGFAVLYELKLK